MLVKTRTNREAYHDCVECRHKLGGTLHVVGSRKRCDPVDAIHNNIYIHSIINAPLFCHLHFTSGSSPAVMLSSGVDGAEERYLQASL